MRRNAGSDDDPRHVPRQLKRITTKPIPYKKIQKYIAKKTSQTKPNTNAENEQKQKKPNSPKQGH